MKKFFLALAILVGLILLFFVFVPAFRGTLIISPTISFALFSIRWYGMILAGAILVGYSLAVRNASKFGMDKTEIENLSFWLVVVGILGARLYYVISLLPYFSQHPGEIYMIWHGGLSIYGAIIVGLFFLFFHSRKKKLNFYKLLDLIALSVPLGQALGRFGNFFNQEAFGTPTNLPWGMYVSPTNRPAQFADSNFFHPAFLYEAIWDVIIFLVLRKLLGRVRTGTLALVYFFLYSLGRFFIESIRLDSSFINGFRVDQITSFLLVLTACLLIFFRVEKQRQS